MCLYDSEEMSMWFLLIIFVTLEFSHLQGIENETGEILGKPYSREIMYLQLTQTEIKF